MKKILLAAASILALSFLIACKQQINGELNITNYNNNKSLDEATTKTYYYSPSGSIEISTTTTVYNKAGNYNSSIIKEISTYIPKKDITVTETVNPNNNTINYELIFPCDLIKTVETTTKASSTAQEVKTKDITDKTRANISGTFSLFFRKTDGKFYYLRNDGSFININGIDFNAATIDLSKFSDPTVIKTESYSGATYNNTTDNASATPTDYITKTTVERTGAQINVIITKK